jgi:hypothetical protein
MRIPWCGCGVRVVGRLVGWLVGLLVGVVCVGGVVAWWRSMVWVLNGRVSLLVRSPLPPSLCPISSSSSWLASACPDHVAH